MKPIVQISLDIIDLDEAISHARMALSAGVDWLEAGTPLILAEGMRAVRTLREQFPEIPIICDPSHIAGDSQMIEEVSQTAMDLNLNGLMIETHYNPNEALSDAKQQITPNKLYQIINDLVLRKTNPDDDFLNIKLKEFREKIDILDRQIVSILSDRKKIVEQIANFKQQNKITIFQLKRWFEILRCRKKDAIDFMKNEFKVKVGEI